MTDSLYLHLLRTDCPLPPGTHVVIYCRDSGGEEQDRSVVQQIQAAQEYCQHYNLVIERTYMDEARQSSNTTRREQLQDMLTDLHAQFRLIHDRNKRQKLAVDKPFGVIFWKSNRLGRDSIEAMHIKTDLRMRGITIIDLVTSANTGNAPIDALIEAFQQWQDEQLLDEISNNSRRGLAQLIGMRDTDPEFRRWNPDWPSTGRFLGLRPGKVPRGFKGERIKIGEYSRKSGRNSGQPRIVQRLVPDPETWDLCYLAWQMRRSGASLHKVHQATHLFTTIGSYDTFFSNMIYTGRITFGDAIYEDFVPALIPLEWFEDEQKNRADRGNKQRSQRVRSELEPRRVGGGYLLSGLVACGHVDGEEHPMNVESISAAAGKRGKYAFYICTRMKNSRGNQCQARRISVRGLDQAVINNLLEQVLTVENLRPLAQELIDSLKERSGDAGTRIRALEVRLADIERSMSNILDAFENMGYARQLQLRYDERLREQQETLVALDQLRRMHASSQQIRVITEKTLEDWVSHLRAALEGQDKEAARAVIRHFVAKIVVKAGTGTIYYSFPFPDAAYMPSLGDLDPRGHVLYPSQKRRFTVLESAHAVSVSRHAHKLKVKAEIVRLRNEGHSLREIGQMVGLHWTRVWQVLS